MGASQDEVIRITSWGFKAGLGSYDRNEALPGEVGEVPCITAPKTRMAA